MTPIRKLQKTKWALLGLLAVGSAFAISDKDATQFLNEYDANIAPYYATGETGSFSGVDGVPISYYKKEVQNQDEEKAAIIILTGRAESYIKYAEVMYDLNLALGAGTYSFYAMDHRGQGYSGRLLSNSEIGYVKSFDDYAVDVNRFIEQIVNQKKHKRKFIIAHSMGGAVAARYLEKYGRVFDGVILSSPMFEPNTGSYSNDVALEISEDVCFSDQILQIPKIPFLKWKGAANHPPISTPMPARRSVDRALAFGGGRVKKWTTHFLNPLKQIEQVHQDLERLGLNLDDLFPTYHTHFCEDYAFGQKGYDPNYSFEANDVTSSKPRFSLWRETIQKENRHGGFAMGGASFSWVKESIRGARKAIANADKINHSIPFLVLEAGSDQIVHTDAEDHFCDAVTECYRNVYGGSQHEILMESDSIRDSALRDVVNFVKVRSGSAG